MTFTGSDNSHLKIPYMGFFGDWAEPAIFDGLNGLAFNPKNNNLGTIITAGNKNGAIGYAGLSQDDAGNYHIDPDAIALSTADGASVSWLKPQYFLFRNANDVKAEILNQDMLSSIMFQLGMVHISTNKLIKLKKYPMALTLIV